MAAPTSVAALDLTPIPGKQYFSITRAWREEFIYFLLIDRFHDDQPRAPVLQPSRRHGINTPDDFFGGKIKGITNNLSHIAGLGCTAIWLSPIFENNAHAYHGYDINHYLNVAPRFGTEQDLIDLVDAAHTFQKNDQPWPMWYHRHGHINNFDTAPENQRGDIVSLKDFANDDDAIGSAVINTLIKAHAYWMRVADVDGFRVDAVKHMGELACSRFCSNIREYAYRLGKHGFFLFGEVASADDGIYNRYIGQNTSRQDGNNTVFFGLDAVLDFRLAEGRFADENNAPLRDVLKGSRASRGAFPFSPGSLTAPGGRHRDRPPYSAPPCACALVWAWGRSLGPRHLDGDHALYKGGKRLEGRGMVSLLQPG